MTYGLDRNFTMGRKTLIFGCLGVQINKISHIAENLHGILKPRSMGYFLAERENFPTGLCTSQLSSQNSDLVPDPSARIHIIPRMASLFSWSEPDGLFHLGYFGGQGLCYSYKKLDSLSLDFHRDLVKIAEKSCVPWMKFFLATSTLFLFQRRAFWNEMIVIVPHFIAHVLTYLIVFCSN